jgi:hypothetical protein
MSPLLCGAPDVKLRVNRVPASYCVDFVKQNAHFATSTDGFADVSIEPTVLRSDRRPRANGST